MPLRSESKVTLGREDFELADVCVYLFLSLGFFKGKQGIVLQLQPALAPSFNQRHPFFHL